jgi:LysM repeat protein
MGAKLVAGFIGFVLLVLFVQSVILGGDDDSLDPPGLSGAAPTATLPAQTPVAVLLGEGAAGGGSTGGATTGGGTYVVQSGDTLGSIAASFNVAPEAQADWVAQVLELNGIPDARLLQAGQELIIPTAQAATPNNTPANNGPSATQAPTSNPTATPPARSGTGGGGTYIVVSGDTPLGIAAKHCVEGAAAWANELVALNGIDAANLSVGDELELPANTPDQCAQ